MAINDIVQTIAEARVDARSLSEFVFKPAGFKVARRLAPTVDTLQFYINRFNSLNGDFSSSVSVALSSLNNSVSEAEGKVAYIETTVQEAINNTVLSSGFITIDSFELGATITERNQALRHAVDGRLYRWAGDLPKTVPASSTPTSTGGFSANAWLEVSDNTLRQEVNTSFSNLDGLNHLQFTPNLTGAVDPSEFILKTENKRNIAKNSSSIQLFNEAVFSNGSSFIYEGNDSTLESTGTRRLISVTNGTLSDNVKLEISNTRLKQAWNPDDSSGGSNNNSVIYARGVENPKIFNNFISASMGVSTSPLYTDNMAVSYKTEFAKVFFNHFKDQQKQCVETFGSDHNVVVGNTGNVPLLNSNAIRIVGGERNTDDGDYSLSNVCSVFAANTFKGGQGTVGGAKYSSSVSLQTQVFGANVVAQAANGFYNAVNIKGGYRLANQGRGNYVQATAVDCDTAVFSEGARSTSVNIVAYNYKYRGIDETVGNAGLLTGAMKYSGLLVGGADTLDKSMRILNNGSQFDMLVDLRDGGSDKRSDIYGDNHSGIISFIGSSGGAVNLYCNNSNLQITVREVDFTNTDAIAFRVYGNNNTFTFNTQGMVRLEGSASGNVLLGRAGRIIVIEPTLASNNTFMGNAATTGFTANNNIHVNAPVSSP